MAFAESPPGTLEDGFFVELSFHLPPSLTYLILRWGVEGVDNGRGTCAPRQAVDRFTE